MAAAGSRDVILHLTSIGSGVGFDHGGRGGVAISASVPMLRTAIIARSYRTPNANAPSRQLSFVRPPDGCNDMQKQTPLNRPEPPPAAQSPRSRVVLL